MKKTNEDSDKKGIVIEDQEGYALGSNYKRKILVYGFYNILVNLELSSACCIDCYAGFHGDNAVQRIELQSGDYIVASHVENYIKVINKGTILKLKEFVLTIPAKSEINKG
jgi:hypothetical protein